ncbi:hypothetical protein F2Q70_00014020 [Brassica cretica]|uniref:Uncharacterized protein n=1 Tax=Brassica cretica TaxID=69181 RepID=A0A8S9I630_BRACR|nr:hypothetical protein F2Q70_00014020 [Brassica cretica]KAF2601000.1 hypothetical protein F2Q68_00007053 [Brassica cretica]
MKTQFSLQELGTNVPICPNPAMKNVIACAKRLQQANPLSLANVSTKLELKEVIELLLSNHEILKTNQRASKEAYGDLSIGIFSISISLE